MSMAIGLIDSFGYAAMVQGVTAFTYSRISFEALAKSSIKTQLFNQSEFWQNLKNKR